MIRTLSRHSWLSFRATRSTRAPLGPTPCAVVLRPASPVHTPPRPGPGSVRLCPGTGQPDGHQTRAGHRGGLRQPHDASDPAAVPARLRRPSGHVALDRLGNGRREGGVGRPHVTGSPLLSGLIDPAVPSSLGGARHTGHLRHRAAARSGVEQHHQPDQRHRSPERNARDDGDPGSGVARGDRHRSRTRHDHLPHPDARDRQSTGTGPELAQADGRCPRQLVARHSHRQGEPSRGTPRPPDPEPRRGFREVRYPLGTEEALAWTISFSGIQLAIIAILGVGATRVAAARSGSPRWSRSCCMRSRS